MEAKGEDVVIEIVLVNRKNVTHLIFQSPFKDLYTRSQCQFRRTCKSSFFCIIINYRFFFLFRRFLELRQNLETDIWDFLQVTFFELLCKIDPAKDHQTAEFCSRSYYEYTRNRLAFGSRLD